MQIQTTTALMQAGELWMIGLLLCMEKSMVSWDKRTTDQYRETFNKMTFEEFKAFMKPAEEHDLPVKIKDEGEREAFWTGAWEEHRRWLRRKAN